MLPTWAAWQSGLRCASGFSPPFSHRLFLSEAAWRLLSCHSMLSARSNEVLNSTAELITSSWPRNLVPSSIKNPTVQQPSLENHAFISAWKTWSSGPGQSSVALPYEAKKLQIRSTKSEIRNNTKWPKFKCSKQEAYLTSRIWFCFCH